MANIEFTNNSVKVKDAIKDICLAWLEEASAEIESQAKRNTRVATGQTKGSFSHTIDEKSLEAQVGSPMENAIWEEFGTGIYAENGDGRKDAWCYQSANGEWCTTNGKQGTRALQKAFTALKSKLVTQFESKFKELS